VSISRAFPHGSEDDRQSFIELAQRLAEEYGLQTEVEARGYFVTLRFSREDAETIASDAPAISLVEKVRSWLKTRFGAASESDATGGEGPAESSREVKS
jgi:hypothetical protein